MTSRRSLLKALALLPFWGLAAREVVEEPVIYAVFSPGPSGPIVMHEFSFARAILALQSGDWSAAPYEKALKDTFEDPSFMRRQPDDNLTTDDE